MAGRKRRVSSSSSDDESPRPKKAANISILENTDIRAGRILKMTLKNFMCHSFLEVEFDGNVNFLTGNNGSGKSAILAALALGLGSNAKTTNRGNISSIKTFIKFGTNSASIEITLNNIGPQAYKVEEYGPKITIQRHMMLSGASRYKIKDSSGKVVSQKAKDIQEITSALNIQVDNPVCILSQDTARNFLNATDPKMRFNLFYRATRLDNLDFLYEDAIKKKNMALDKFKVKKAEETALVKQTKKYENKISEISKVEELQNELKVLEAELAWGKAIINEKKFEQHKSVITQIEKELNSKEDLYDKFKEKLVLAQEGKRKIEKELREFGEAHLENEIPYQELSRKIKTVQEDISQKKNAIESIERQLSYKKQDLESIHELISSYNERVSSIEKRKVAKAEELINLEQQKKDKNSLIVTYEDDINKLSEHIREKESNLETYQHQLRASTNKMNTLKDKLSTLQKDSNNPCAIYGSNYIRLINAIQSERQNFSQPPIGPIGAYVSVKDKQWTLAVEAHLGAGLLCSFLVSSQRDLQRLNNIIKQVWPRGVSKPTVISMEFMDKVYDISKRQVANHPNCVRLSEAISVSNPVVMNCLIDYSRIESILLIPDKSFGYKIMKDQRTVPQNCRLALTPTADTFYPDPNYKMYSGRLRQPKYIQVDCAEIARQCKQALAEETHINNELRASAKSIRDGAGTISENLRRLSQKVATYKQELSVIVKKIGRLQSETVEAAGNIDDLQADAAQLEQLIKDKSSTAHEAGLEIESLREELKNYRQEIKQFDDARIEARRTKDHLQNQINAHEFKVQTLNSEIVRAKRNRDLVEEKLSTEKATLVRLQNNWENGQAEVQEMFGDRPETIRRGVIVEDMINNLNKRILSYGKYDLDKIQRELKLLTDRINAHRESMRETEQTLIGLEAAKSGRKAKLVNTKKYMKEYAKYHFINFLKCRNFQGNMDINYDSQSLELCVMPHSGVAGVTATTNLSGGERSFSTVAFLYALWKALDFPFYILDEFDVYMDSQNRNMVIKILIDHAKKNKEVQYVFLTPQDISFIKDAQVAIHRLEDPERRALTQ